jgi:uncharacterized lipoprotein YajG
VLKEKFFSRNFSQKNQKKMKILRILAFIALLGFCSAHVNVLQFFKHDKLAEV